MQVHCKSAGGKIETWFTVIVLNTVECDFFICNPKMYFDGFCGLFCHWLFSNVSGITMSITDEGKGL